jgi:two-component system sensor histidine kinase KdpD
MASAPAPASLRLARERPVLAGYVVAIGTVLAATILAALLRRWLGLSDLSLLYMLAVVAVAARSDTGPAAFAALLSFLAYNFFFIEPRYTLYIAARHGVATVLLFLAAALLAGRLAARLARQVDALDDARRHTDARHRLAQRLADARDEDAIIDVARAAFADALQAEVWVQMRPAPQPAGAAATVDDKGWWFLPLAAADEVFGMLGLRMADAAPRLADADRATVRAMAADVAQALVRVRLARALQDERVAREAERARSALLSSVSHDLRTPLASIIGAAESLEAFGDAMPADDRRGLVDAIVEQGRRLDRYIQNLLDMTRLGHGSLVPARDWVGIDELIGSATERLQRSRPSVRFDIRLPRDLAPIHVQGPLIEQVVYNLIDNAAKFASGRKPIGIDVRRDADVLEMRVTDDGPGIAADERERIFEMFHTDAHGDRIARGTGLGLAICKAIVEAHGGRIAAEDVAAGASVVVRLPVAEVTP